MHELKVKSKIQNYSVIINEQLDELITENIDNETRYFVIADKKISSLYFPLIKNISFNSILLEIEGGETAKTMETYNEVVTELLKNKITKKDKLIAIGGGTIGDLVGYVAATYKRGIGFINIPTTTLSMIDSSIGGKNAINIENVKNAIGTIYPPEKVLIGLDTLKTLDERNVNNGLFEALKMGLILNKDIYDLFNSKNEKSNLFNVILLSIKEKIKIVEEDETEQNIRRILNFGHSFGHAIEAYLNYELLHGEAIANGMLIVSYKEAYYQELLNIITRLNCPIVNKIQKDKLLEIMKNDKKGENNKINIIRVHEIGKATIEIAQYEELDKELTEYGF